MAITSTVKVRGYIQSLGAGRVEIETVAFTDAASVPQRLMVELASGPNDIDVPVGARGCIITLPPTSTRTKILKGNNTDVGIQISTTGLGGTFYLIFGVISQFVVDCSGADTGLFTEFQFF